ncbi:hypothetical protein [Pseudomonas fluorescens]|uniref:hypothetical protein n=1 Tax=Pseudomonas fluorescens TaxID=294 RepID=UPI0006427E6C|nr:hypothetical protein [Pseudomonas fluorescens]
MSEFYDRMAATALRLITQYGQPVTLRETTTPEYDPDNPGGGDAVIEQTAQGILLDFTGLEFQNDTLIVRGDKKLKVAALGMAWAPKPLIAAEVQGKAWTVINVKEINPAGTPLLYELQVRS